MAAGDVKTVYAASANEGTLTALNSLASSSDWTAGWESTTIDNSTNKYLDYRLTVKLSSHSVAPTANTEMRVYVVGMLDDATWQGGFDGSVGTVTVTDTEVRDAICKLAAVTAVDTTTSQAYGLDCPSVRGAFGGFLPEKFAIFITQNTGQVLLSSGNQVTTKGSYENVAQS